VLFIWLLHYPSLSCCGFGQALCFLAEPARYMCRPVVMQLCTSCDWDDMTLPMHAALQAAC
jgi:hypothetical protein